MFSSRIAEGWSGITRGSRLASLTLITWIAFGLFLLGYMRVQYSDFVPSKRVAVIAIVLSAFSAFTIFLFFIGVGGWSALGYRFTKAGMVPQKLPLVARALLAMLLGPGAYFAACGVFGNTIPSAYTSLTGTSSTETLRAIAHRGLYVRGRGFVCEYPRIYGIPDEMVGKGTLCGTEFADIERDDSIVVMGSGTSLGIQVNRYRVLRSR
jgi:hypothetical protein